jgi:hypothetical protein
VAGNNKSERLAAGNGSKRGWRPEEGLPWPKRSDCSIGGGRGILDLDNKDACNWGGRQAGGWVRRLVAAAAIAVTDSSPGDRNINDNVK